MNIERISTEQAAVGMITATDIFAKNKLLIEKNTELTDRSIIRLKLYGIRELKIFALSESKHNRNNVNKTNENKNNEKGNIKREQSIRNISSVTDDEVSFGNTLSNENVAYNQDNISHLTKVRKTKEFIRFQDSIINYATSLKSYLNRIIKSNEQLDTEKLAYEIEAILMESRNGLHVIDMINSMRIYDDDTYIHSINVSLLCYVMGKWMNYTLADTRLLALSGLLHDIGKLMIPQDLIAKPTDLTPEEYLRIKEHTNKGYFILKNQNLDDRVKRAALMHHEKCDGSGYPLGISRDQIDSFAKIVAIADIYEAMTAKRVYRGPICPFDVVAIFEKEGLQKYDPAYLLIFLERVIESYINNWVLLSNEEKAEIIMINKYDLAKPVVRTQHSDFIDLSKERDIEILAII
jgi:putative nucleotidyltransferase with HDIG domain